MFRRDIKRADNAAEYARGIVAQSRLAVRRLCDSNAVWADFLLALSSDKTK